MTMLDHKHQAALYWWGIVIYFALFSFNALATSTLAALVGTKWGVLTGQEKFLIGVAIAANWTGLILVFIQKSVSRLSHGKPPIETGDTEQRTR
jgi:hypothetical protein